MLNKGRVASLALAAPASLAFAQPPSEYQRLAAIESTAEPLRGLPVMHAMAIWSAISGT